MENITFINEDTIRYKYYCHGNGKWKANRCKIVCYARHEHFYNPKKRVILLFLVTSNLKWKCKKYRNCPLCLITSQPTDS